MNHIHKLQAEVTILTAQQATQARRIQELREHLASPKFDAVQQDGTRGDWISVADVQRWLRYIEQVSE